MVEASQDEDPNDLAIDQVREDDQDQGYLQLDQKAMAADGWEFLGHDESTATAINDWGHKYDPAKGE
jgi:hypothetical protein